ncbi:putative baseplate assembly protein [Streptomyces sp. ISL-10]|uniref:putative baseplate assembly protein n=1 Tax=Streptomyces sp. ISL-10 TaxID=2819172 RepID=UPI001BE63E02|nr:putative baseplate assembly protein [Streptomyces sp. ISL-10]MBT2369862.1 putative baseplate assembly protein [Streptomyces sp. ISL-10]
MTSPPVRDDEHRRAAVRDAGLAGIETVTVDPERRTLTVSFFGTLPQRLDRHSFLIEGGRRISGIRVLRVGHHTEPDSRRRSADRLVLTLDRPGDDSLYQLRALGWGFDRRYDRMEFTFRPAGLVPPDHAPAVDGHLPSRHPAPSIDYLAKDYASFRRLLLERLALTMPEWTERRAPDLGVTLVELLAHIGDRLSYQQDAVATEAYLDTARLRTSVRRHARLVDYPMHDGCAARTVVCVETKARRKVHLDSLAFTSFPEHGVLQASSPEISVATLKSSPHPVYRPMERRNVVLHPAHNSISLWAWGEDEYHLHTGATRATLLDQASPGHGGGRVLKLVPGDVLVFEEVLGPGSGHEADRDPTHRQAVRLTDVTRDVDVLSGTQVLDVAWADEDALTFPLCVRSRDTAHGCPVEVAVARGNAVLVEHGIENVWLPEDTAEEVPVPGPVTTRTPGAPPLPRHAQDPGRPRPFVATLGGTPVTRSAPHPRPADVAAAQARQLLRIADRARDRLLDLQHAAANPSPDDRAYFGRLFGTQLLDGLLDDEGPGRALTPLLARFDEYLEPELRRLEALARRARSGYVLDGAETGWELTQTWGEDAARAVHPDNPALHGPVSAALNPDPREALPQVRIVCCEEDDTHPEHAWTPRRDLLASGPRDRHVVGETDDDGVLRIRFGDGRAGAAPTPGTTLCATYRTGNGRAGNLGSEAVNRIVCRETELKCVTRVRNPVPATGGTDPESVAEVRLAAPREPFRKLLRAVTAEDYATLAARRPDMQRAAAALRWTGSWYEADVALDPIGTYDVPHRLLEDVRSSLYRFRRIGHDVVTRPALQVPLDVALDVLVEDDHIAGHVREALLTRLRPGVRPDGGRGFFDPDALTFGTPVRASELVAVAVSVPGVRHADVIRLRRLHSPSHGGRPGPDVPPSGELRLGALEIARLDADVTRPENGRLTLRLRGGR